MLTCTNCRSDNDDDAVTCFTCGSSLGSTAAIRRGSLISNRYEIQEPLGKGGMGMVYKAHDRDLDETVALKLLRADIAADPEMQKRFRSEIKLARKVRHRNVCGINEYGQDGNIRYIAMEYLEGVDLRHVLQRKGAPLPEEAFEISIQVGQGLQAIHDAGIVHRDLKTPNIMRDKVGHVRLMDFGIAKQIGAEATMGATQMGMIVGTPEYMSPEQARGEKIDFRSDIYAWGIVTFEIFTGAVPFKGDTPIATIFKHLQEEPPLHGAGLPESLIPVLAKSLAKNPGDRYNNCTEMVDALQEARAVAFPNWKPTPSGSMRAPGAGPSLTPLPGTSVMPTPSPTRIPNQPSTLVKDGATPRPQPTVMTPRPQPSPTVRTPAPSPEVQHRQAAVRDLLARAEGLASAQRLDEAHDVLKQAAEIEPGSTLVNRLLAQTAADIKRHQDAQNEERRKHEAQQQAEVERAAAERAAAERVEKDRRAQAERRAAAERAAAEQAAARQREAQQQAEAERAHREAAERQAAQRQAAEKIEAARRAESDRLRQKAEAERAAAEKAKAAAEEERRRREGQDLRRQQEATLVPGGAQAAPLMAAPSPPRAVSSGGMGWVLPVGGAAVLAVLVVIGVVISRLGPVQVSPQPTTFPSAPLPPEPSPPNLPGMGVLVVDALPWAEVTDIVDANGKHHTPGATPFTPLTLSLPPGEYTVSLRNPAAPLPRTLSGRVEASGTKHLSAEFQKIDVDDYFNKTGW